MIDFLKSLFFQDGEFSKTKTLSTLGILATIAGFAGQLPAQEWIVANAEGVATVVALLLAWFLRDGMSSNGNGD